MQQTRMIYWKIETDSKYRHVLEGITSTITVSVAGTFFIDPVALCRVNISINDNALYVW